MSESDTTPEIISNPSMLHTPFGPATVLPIDLFLHRALPPLRSGIEIQKIADRLMRTGKNSSSRRPITREGRWWGFARDPAQMNCNPKVAFQNLPYAVLSIIKASHSNIITPSASISFKNNPHHTERIICRKEGDLPDAYFLSSEPPAWTNIIASGEYQQTDTEDDREAKNVPKVVKSMAECLNHDARRRFTFAFTIENTSMRLWYGSRCQIIASEPFNFITNREPMIHFFLALTYADPCQLGWDMSMTPLEDGRNFDIRIDSLDGTQCVYRTQKLLSCPGPFEFRGKGTRVWKAVLLDKGTPQGDPIILKDAWVDADRETEGAILDNIRAIPVNTETHAPKYLEDAFPTTICHGYVFVDADKTHVDSVRLLSPADDLTAEEHENILPFGLRSSIQSTRLAGSPEPVGRWLAHYRIVFKEVGRPLSREQSLPAIFKTLAQIAYALHHLHQGGWIHRDISVGNILVVGERGTLIDMEYATKMAQGPECRIGTRGFVPVEVEDQAYLLRWAVPSPKGPKKVRRPIPSREEVVRRLWPTEGEELPEREIIVPELSPEPPFRYNTLHDLESLWWVAVYFLIKRRVVDETQGPPSPEDLAALAPQCQLASQLFDNSGHERLGTLTVDGIFANHRRVLHPSVHRVAIILDQLRQGLCSAYITQEADPLSTNLVPDIHSTFINTLLDIADAPLEHIKLLPLPPTDIWGNVIISDASATRGTKRNHDDRDAEAQSAVIEENLKRQTKRTRIATRRTNLAERTRPYLPRKAKTPRTIDKGLK
ncbi:hypothetical protein EIP86_001394 [Pleurotus ostreatoroseus]|nr:hypothetical protein EIP86_001394 [Pleurotus ostreatoroseus]